MTAWAWGLAAAVALWSLGGGRRPWPWRVTRLSVPVHVGHRGPVATPRRRRVGRSRSTCRGAPHRWSPRRRADGRADQRADDLVTVIDQLHVTVSAGHSLHAAIAAVADADGGPVASALATSHAAFTRGRTMADALAVLGTVGPDVEVLQATLVAALHSGAAPAPALQRLADQLRRRRRRQAESRVRRLPVLLLAPLVGLVLPAFVVVTIVPVALTTARAGLLPASA